MSNSSTQRSEQISLLKEILYPLLFDVLYPKQSAKRSRHREISPPTAEDINDAVSGYPEVDDFSEYVSTTLQPTLPLPSSTTLQSFNPESYHPPPDLLETLLTYSIFPDSATAEVFIESVIGEYVKALEAEIIAAGKGEIPEVGVLRSAPGGGGRRECEICERETRLTFHHLIPKSTHAKVLKRKWHRPEDVNKGTWICRPCHSMVHKLEPNETLARKYYTVELIMEREEMQRWAAWIGRQKGRGRRT